MVEYGSLGAHEPDLIFTQLMPGTAMDWREIQFLGLTLHTDTAKDDFVKNQHYVSVFRVDV